MIPKGRHNAWWLLKSRACQSCSYYVFQIGTPRKIVLKNAHSVWPTAQEVLKCYLFEAKEITSMSAMFQLHCGNNLYAWRRFWPRRFHFDYFFPYSVVNILTYAVVVFVSTQSQLNFLRCSMSLEKGSSNGIATLIWNQRQLRGYLSLELSVNAATQFFTIKIMKKDWKRYALSCVECFACSSRWPSIDRDKEVLKRNLDIK